MTIDIPPSTYTKQFYPIFKSAKNQYCFDISGKKYLDFTGANQTIVLGYQKYDFKYVPNYPGQHFLEYELNNILSSKTPHKMFRYFKNGNDAVMCAIRVALAYLNSDNPLIVFNGYHGTNDYYTRLLNPNGIPRSIQTITYDDLLNDPLYETKLQTHDVIYIFEEKNAHKTLPHYPKVKICDHLKEGITALYNPTKLGTINLYGKSIANGYPFAIAGFDEVYGETINKIRYTTTFAHDLTGIEAALYTIKHYDKVRQKHVDLLRHAETSLPKWFSLPSDKIKYLYKKYSILYNGYYQIMTCHTKKDINVLSEIIKKEEISSLYLS